LGGVRAAACTVAVGQLPAGPWHTQRAPAHCVVFTQVEVKLRLPGPEAHAQLAALLAPGRVATHQQVCAVCIGALQPGRWWLCRCARLSPLWGLSPADGSAAAATAAPRRQENYFFDGPSRELNGRLVVLRVRFYDTDKKAVLTLKVCWRGLCRSHLPARLLLPSASRASAHPHTARTRTRPHALHHPPPAQGKQVLQDGIGRATEVEEPLDPLAARQFLTNPSALLGHPSELMQSLARCAQCSARAQGVCVCMCVCVCVCVCVHTQEGAPAAGLHQQLPPPPSRCCPWAPFPSLPLRTPDTARTACASWCAWAASTTCARRSPGRASRWSWTRPATRTARCTSWRQRRCAATRARVYGQ
jgi:hypothetical protein